MNTNINLLNDLLKIRTAMQAVSQESFNYSTLNKQFPIANLNEEQAKKVYECYQEIIGRLKLVLKNY